MGRLEYTVDASGKFAVIQAGRTETALWEIGEA
jgi:hypothetical protein